MVGEKKSREYLDLETQFLEKRKVTTRISISNIAEHQPLQ